MTDWEFRGPNGISADGRAIVGYAQVGALSAGDQRAFIAVIPEPSAATGLLFGVAHHRVTPPPLRAVEPPK